MYKIVARRWWYNKGYAGSSRVAFFHEGGLDWKQELGKICQEFPARLGWVVSITKQEDTNVQS